MKRLVRSVA